MNSELPPSIKVQGLTKKFGDFTAVGGIDFEVRPGEIFGFLGPNGSGKTTTIRMILGLLKPTAGQVEVLGVTVHELPRAIRRRVGYMSQRFSLYNDLTVVQNLRFYGKVYGLSDQALAEEIDHALDRAGLTGQGSTRTKDLSGGWRQRLALSAAILHQPEILFLDEPTAGVDPLSRRAFWDLLYQLVDEGVTVFVTTHYMEEAEHCHRLALIQQGRLIAYGAPAEIKQEKMPDLVLEVVVSDPAKALTVLQRAIEEKTIPVHSVEAYGSLIHVIVPRLPDSRPPITQALSLAGLEPQRMAFIEPSLEDVFIACMR